MSGADLEYQRMLAEAGKTSADRLDGARLEQLADIAALNKVGNDTALTLAEKFAGGDEDASAVLDEAFNGHVPGLSLGKVHAALSRRRGRRCNIVMIGASLVEGFPVTSYDSTITQRLARRLRERYSVLSGGRGYVGIPTAGPALTSPVVISGGARDPAAVGAGEAFNLGANRNCWYTNGSGYVEYTCGPNATNVDIWHMKAPAGGATAGAWQINGGSVTTFSTLNGVDILNATRVEVNPGDVLRVSRSGAGYIIVNGFTEYGDDEASGIQVHNAGHSGYTAARWTVAGLQAGGWRTHLSTLNPDLLVISDLGVNDGNSGSVSPVSSSQFRFNLTAFLTALRAGAAPLDTVPILLVAAYDTSSAITFVSPWQEYVEAHREAAALDLNAGVLDLTKLMPPTSDTSWGIYAGDGTHGNLDGSSYDLMADHIFRAIT